MQKNNQLTKDVILFLDDEHYLGTDYHPEYEKVSETTEILPLSSITELEKKGYSFEYSRNMPKPNDVFIRHPFVKNCFVELSSAEKVLSDYKLEGIVQVSSKLGAIYVDYEQSLLSEERQYLEIDGTVKTAPVAVTLEYKKEYAENHLGNYKDTRHLSGEYSVENYREAAEIAKRYNIYLKMKELIEKRNPDDNNPIDLRNIRIIVSDELNEMKEAALSITAKKLPVGISSSIKKEIESKRTIVTKLMVVFPQKCPKCDSVTRQITKGEKDGEIMCRCLNDKCGYEWTVSKNI